MTFLGGTSSIKTFWIEIESILSLQYSTKQFKTDKKDKKKLVHGIKTFCIQNWTRKSFDNQNENKSTNGTKKNLFP